MLTLIGHVLLAAGGVALGVGLGRLVLEGLLLLTGVATRRP